MSSLVLAEAASERAMRRFDGDVTLCDVVKRETEERQSSSFCASSSRTNTPSYLAAAAAEVAEAAAAAEAPAEPVEAAAAPLIRVGAPQPRPPPRAVARRVVGILGVARRVARDAHQALQVRRHQVGWFRWLGWWWWWCTIEEGTRRG